MTAAARFTQSDLKRATAGVLSAGLQIAKIEINRNGSIIIIPGNDKQRTENEEWADLE